MTVRVYRSTDSSAPVISGTAGTVITTLDAILVNGYGSKTAAGWAKEFSGTNKAAYRAATGNRLRMRIDDSGAQDSRVIGYEVMTDVDTGTGLFPTALQLSGGMYVHKSSTADGTARPWVCYADGKTFYLFIFAAQTVLGNSSFDDGSLFFGDFSSYVAGDVYNTILHASAAATGAGTTLSAEAGVANVSTFVSGTAGLYGARAYTQIGAARKLARLGRDMTHAVNSTLGGVNAASYSAYPDPIVGGLLMSPVDLWEETAASNFSRRGKLRGMWVPHHPVPGGVLDSFDGVGSLAGKSFDLVPGWSAANGGRLILETSDTW